MVLPLRPLWHRPRSLHPGPREGDRVASSERTHTP